VRPLTLKFKSGPHRGRTAEFITSPVRVGRSRDNDVVLPEDLSPESSARHAEFRYENDAWWIVDLDSTNGTILNGSAVRRARLEGGDRVGFGDISVVVGRRSRRGLVLTLLVGALLVAALSTGFVAWRTTQGPLDRIATAGSRSAYLIVLDDGGRVLPVGSAFAIDASGRLASNAHVASPIAEALTKSRPGVPYAIAYGETSRRRIVGVTVDPKWKAGSVESDVGLLQLEPGAPTTAVRLADPAAVSGLRAGTAVAIYGFPAAFTDPNAPKASIAANVVRELRGANYMIVGIAVAPGSSGSPVFTYDGTVVGIVAGTSRIEGEGSAAAPAVALTIVPLRALLGAR
jgi:S1-C subfamily serine protease